MVKIGDRYKEYMVPFPNEYFDWVYEVVELYTNKLGDFARCIQHYKDGKTEECHICVELLTEGVFYTKI